MIPPTTAGVIPAPDGLCAEVWAEQYLGDGIGRVYIPAVALDVRGDDPVPMVLHGGKIVRANTIAGYLGAAWRAV